MKQSGLRIMVYAFLIVLMFSCAKKDAKNQFEVSGLITNSTAKMVYLEEVPAGSDQGIIVDSSVLSKEGRYKLKAAATESVVYNLRLDHSDFPIASVINDVPKMTLDVDLHKGDNQFPDKYDVKGSAASQKLKDFVYTFNNELQEIFFLNQKGDSLHKKNAPDSVVLQVMAEWKSVAAKIRNYSRNALENADDPALFIFELGYYQSNANESSFGLEPIDITQVLEMVNEAGKRYPSHQGLSAVKARLEERLAQIKQSEEPRWVGKPAPDFSLPDVSGNTVSLSSFKGKYVLVDFWASWCNPCRAENPNVVKAYARFRNRNFAILGVSLDRPGGKNEWLKAIKSDNLSWTQVSDLKEWNSVVVPLYGLDGIPYNILINTEGVVIAENLRGPALEEKLNEVLK